MCADLPAELLILIFRFAFDDDLLLAPTLPTSWDASSWFKSLDTKWVLRSPQDNLAVLQRRRLTCFKAISSTCRFWRQVGTEFLYQSIFIEIPSRLIHLCGIFDRNRHLSHCTKRLHVTRYFCPGGFTTEDLDISVISILQHCRNLQVFAFEWPLESTSFTPIADALCHHCSRTLHTLQLSLPSAELAKLIWTLDSLPGLIALHIELGMRQTEEVRLGSASDVVLVFPKLEQLSLRGFFTDFVEEAIEWEFPRLTKLSLDFLNYRDELPEFVDFFHNHGTHIEYLDINCIPTLDIAAILDLCPSLTTFSFNPDWRLPRDDAIVQEASALVRMPHRGITAIGLHQLLYAFGVGYGGTYAKTDLVSTTYIRRSNDVNFAALTKRNFPNLKCIRLLSRTLLQDLEEANGPDDVCFERWERWWGHCAKQGIRLEDCTGAELGYLPPTDVDDGDTDDETVSETADSLLAGLHDDPIAQVRALRLQCRQMSVALTEGAVRQVAG